jgi:N-acetylglutamate synthase-like GNAT family acetyltransferase
LGDQIVTTDFTLRSATAGDFPGIRRLIGRVQINPTGLDWRRFVLAVDASGSMLGCGQLKPHGDAILELASIAVEPPYRHRGVARAMPPYFRRLSRLASMLMSLARYDEALLVMVLK